MSELSTFRRFNNLQDLRNFTELLDKYQIKYSLDDNSSTFDVSFANNEVDKDFRLKLAPNDFEKVNSLLIEIYEKELDSIDSGYYLFNFTNEELLEIIIKSDEWSILDYVLAQKLLKERGKEISPELLNILKKQRIDELKKPQKNTKAWISSGYLFALLGGFIGFWIGFMLYSNKKTLPNGNKVYVFNENDRKHGKIIMIISGITFPISLFLRLNLG